MAEHWKIRIWEIQKKYTELRTMKKTAEYFDCSIGLVSEALLLCRNWEKVEALQTRDEALKVCRPHMRNMEVVHDERLNSISLCADASHQLIRFDPEVFDTIITDGKYLQEHHIYQLYRTLKNHSFAYFFTTFRNVEEHRKLLLKQFRILSYPFVVIFDGKFSSRPNHFYDVTELIIIAMKGNPKLSYHSSNVYTTPPVSPVLKIHGMERPIKLIEWILKCSLSSKGNILDPYCNSAEVILAAKNLQHNYHGICRFDRQFDRIMRKVIQHDNQRKDS